MGFCMRSISLAIILLLCLQHSITYTAAKNEQNYNSLSVWVKSTIIGCPVPEPWMIYIPSLKCFNSQNLTSYSKSFFQEISEMSHYNPAS